MKLNKLSILSLFISALAFSQVNLESKPEAGNISSGTPFLDASSYYHEGVSGSNNIGKGLVFPQVDLVNFEFNVTQPDGATVLPTWYDGMVVYNKSTGTTLTTGNRSSTATAVTPGFYYFYNPNGVDNQNVTAGRWVRIDGGNVAPAVPNSLVATGTFTHNGGNSAKLTNVPADIKAITGIKIVRTDDNDALLQGGVAATTFYSYDRANKTMVFGQGVMSTSMPAGTYSYVIEYTK